MSMAETPEERQFIKTAKGQSELFERKETPFFDCTFSVDDKYYCDLLWPESRVMLFTEENRDGYEIGIRCGWTCLMMSDPEITPELLATKVKEV